MNPVAGQLGPVGDNRSEGFYLHPTLVLNARDGSCLGLGAGKLYQREHYGADDPMSDPHYRKLQRRRQSFEQKLSYRWWESANEAAKNTGKAERHTVIADSESDIYELMVKLSKADLDFVLRSYQDRSLDKPNSKCGLSKHMEDQAVKATYGLKLPATDKRTKHDAKLQVKWTTLNLARPKDGQNKHLPINLGVTIVEVTECPSTVVENEKPVHWRLITSHPVENFQQARQIIQWYTWRWVIEQFFRTLKIKGLNICASEVESPHSLYNLTAMSMISAIQIMQLVQARGGNNDLKMQVVFSEEEASIIKKLSPKLEGNTQKLKNPHKPDSLAFATWVIARLGGWSGYASQKPPGPITIKRGLTRIKDALFFSRFNL
jgi:Transposase DDE domain.